MPETQNKKTRRMKSEKMKRCPRKANWIPRRESKRSAKSYTPGAFEKRTHNLGGLKNFATDDPRPRGNACDNPA